MSKLTFEALRKANASRAPRWHTSPEGMNEWTIGDWFMAMAGEVGEGADELLPLMFMSFVGKLGALGNMAKKYRRVQEGIANKAHDPERHITAQNAIAKMFEELADVQIYLDLFALRLRDGLHTGEDIGDHVERKFNKTSELYGFPERIINGEFFLLSDDYPDCPHGTPAAAGGTYPLCHSCSLAADIHEAKYGGRSIGKSPLLAAPYGEQPFNERHVEKVDIYRPGAPPERQRETYVVSSQTIMTIIAPEGEMIEETVQEAVTFTHVEIPPAAVYPLDEPMTLQAGKTYMMGIRNGKAVVFKLPDIPTVWHDGCAKCRWCAMDMDMDPFCTEPSIKEAAGSTVGIGLNAAVRSYCGKDGKLSLFEPRSAS